MACAQNSVSSLFQMWDRPDCEIRLFADGVTAFLPRNGFFREISVFVGGLFVFDSDTEAGITVVLPEFCMLVCCGTEEMACVKCNPVGVNRTFVCKIFYAPPTGWSGVAIQSAFPADGIDLVAKFRAKYF